MSFLLSRYGATPGDQSGRQYGRLPTKGSTSNLNFSFFRVFFCMVELGFRTNKSWNETPGMTPCRYLPLTRKRNFELRVDIDGGPP